MFGHHVHADDERRIIKNQFDGFFDASAKNNTDTVHDDQQDQLKPGHEAVEDAAPSSQSEQRLEQANRSKQPAGRPTGEVQALHDTEVLRADMQHFEP